MPKYKDEQAILNAIEHEPFMLDNVKSAFRTILNKVPTADVAPVVHGEWIHEPFSTSTDNIRCSVCGNMEKTWKDEEPSEFFRYCYQCGAKMDKKQIQTEKSENYIKTKEKNYDKQ